MSIQTKSVIGCIICITLCKYSGAQFTDSIHHYLGYAATGIINQTQNSNSFVLNNGLKFNVSKKNRSLNSGAAWVYGKQNGLLTNNDFTSSMDFNLYGRLPHLYYWGLITYEKSYSLKTNDRFQGGLGVGYNFSDKKDAILVVSNGILYEYSNLKIDSVNNESYSTLRNSLRLKYHFVYKGIIVLDGVHYWQQSLSLGSDYIIKSNSNLSVKLKKWLSITSGLSYNKVNRTSRKNLLFTFGFAADYYF